MQEHADIGDRPEYSYTSTLQREVEQLVDSPSVSKDSRSFRRYTTVREVSNVVSDKRKLNFRHIKTNMSILQTEF
jgi:hypothetical protein